MYPYIVKVEYWNDITDPWTLEHLQVLLYADSITEAVSKFENARYVDNIESIKAICAGDENTFFEVPGHIAKILATGYGNYRDGLKRAAGLLKNKTKIADKLRADAETVAPRENFTDKISFAQEEV